MVNLPSTGGIAPELRASGIFAGSRDRAFKGRYFRPCYRLLEGWLSHAAPANTLSAPPQWQADRRLIRFGGSSFALTCGR